MVFNTIIQRNVKIGEAPSFGESILDYDSTSKGAENYLNLAHEVIEKNMLNGKSKISAVSQQLDKAEVEN